MEVRVGGQEAAWRRRVFLVGFCLSGGLLGGLVVQGAFEAWWLQGTELWSTMSLGEQLMAVGFVALNPLPSALAIGVLLALRGGGSSLVIELWLVLLVALTAAWWWLIASVVTRVIMRREAVEA